jgi:hypothetical protein
MSLTRKQLIRTLSVHGLQVTDEAIVFLLKKIELEGDATYLDRVLRTLDLQVGQCNAHPNRHAN